MPEVSVNVRCSNGEKFTAQVSGVLSMSCRRSVLVFEERKSALYIWSRYALPSTWYSHYKRFSESLRFRFFFVRALFYQVFLVFCPACQPVSMKLNELCRTRPSSLRIPGTPARVHAMC